MDRKLSFINIAFSIFKEKFKAKKSQSFKLDFHEPAILELSRKPKSRTEIANEYGVSIKTLNKWFANKNLNIPQGLICPCDLRLIYATLGPPLKNVETENK